MSSVSLLNLINVLLLINFVAGFLFNQDGQLFSGMFRTKHLIELQKNILNLGVLLISLQGFSWLKNHKHLLEFYMLMLSTLVGMFFMISSGNLLMFWLSLELSTIPLAAMCNIDLEKRISSSGCCSAISIYNRDGIIKFGNYIFSSDPKIRLNRKYDKFMRFI